MSSYPGINYGIPGVTNVDQETGIHYGVISQNDVQPEALDEIMTQGEDVAFKEAKENCIKAGKNALEEWYHRWYDSNAPEGTLKASLRIAVRDAFRDTTASHTGDRMSGEIAEDWGVGDDLEEACKLVEAAIDNHFGDGYESDGGLGDYLYEKDGYKLTGDSGGDLWVLRSKFYTYAQFCSPCAPGAGYLTSARDPDDGAPKCYCLGFDWFEGWKAPYRIWRVEDDVELVVKEVQVECPNCKGSGRDTVTRLAEVRGTDIYAIIKDIQEERINVRDFHGVHGDATFQCWRCSGAGHLVEQHEAEKE